MKGTRPNRGGRAVWGRLKRNRAALGGIILLLIVILSALFADLISPYSRGIDQDAAIRLQGPTWEHPFGTDAYGRDVFTRVIHGGRLSLFIGIAAAAIAMASALILGLSAGYFGGLFDEIIMRITDTLLCIPYILLSLAIVAALGPGLRNLLIALVVSYIPGFTRIVRSVALTIVESDYILAARTIGASDAAILRRHVLRNALGPVLVETTMAVAGMILLQAGLSFVGLGITPPAPEWGSMLAEGREFLRRAPHLMVFPGAAILLTSLSINLVGDGLRDAWEEF